MKSVELKKQWLLKTHTRYTRGRREKAIFKCEKKKKKKKKKKRRRKRERKSEE